MNPDELNVALSSVRQRVAKAWIIAIFVPLLLLVLAAGLWPQRLREATIVCGILTFFALGRARAETQRLKLSRARLLQQAGRHEEALDIYQALFGGERHHEWTETAHYRLAELYDQQGQGPLALGHYREYLKRYKRGRWKLEAEARIAALESGGSAMAARAGSPGATTSAARQPDALARKRRWPLFLAGFPVAMALGVLVYGVVPFPLFPPVMAVVVGLAFFSLVFGIMGALWHRQTCDLELAEGLVRDGRTEEALVIYRRIAGHFIGPGNKARATLGQARLHEARGERLAAVLAYQEYVERCPQGPARVEAAARLRELERELDAPAASATAPVAASAVSPAAFPPSPVSPGQRVGEYILEAPLGRGGFGEVWKARHNSLPGVVVAMKFPTAPEALDGLRRLGQIQHQLDHPRIVKTLGMDPDGHPPYVTMNYVEGESLRQSLQRQGRLPRERALRLFDQLLSAVAHAHGRGVVHRDLKPENVLIDARGDALVTDFELGQVTADFTRQLILSGSLATQDGRSISGTFLYMAPEQRQGEAVDPRSDLYPLGIMLFEMLTGELPQPGDKLGDFLSELPSGLEEVFARCYTRRERRYSTVEELRAAFGAACASFAVGSA